VTRERAAAGFPSRSRRIARGLASVAVVVAFAVVTAVALTALGLVP
jgi:hypothetical protein